MYYNVSMPVISVRVSDEWLAAVDAECELRVWKRNAAIVNLVWQALSGCGVGIVAATGRKCKDTLSTEAGGISPRKSSEGPCDSATYRQVSSPVAPINQSKCPNKDHRGFQRNDGYWCSTCRKMYW